MALSGVHQVESAASEPSPLWWRVAIWLERTLRPALGWGVLVSCALLALVPALVLRANNWLSLGSLYVVLDWSGPLAVVTAWWLWGWRIPVVIGQGMARYLPWRGVVHLLVGSVVVSQLALGWLPGPALLWETVRTGAWWLPLERTITIWLNAAARAGVWWQGVQSGGAAQDNLIFAIIGGSVLWIAGGLTAWLARRTRQGYAAAAPSIWLTGTILLYSSSGKWLLLWGLALAVVLHFFLDLDRLAARWRDLGLDYNPSVMLDRFLALASACALILTLAALMPNLYWRPLVERYYEAVSPWMLTLEGMAERLFPDARGTSRLRGGAVAGGLPNDFLLQGGTDLGRQVIMRVRTDDTPVYQFPFDEMMPPVGHYMRGSTFQSYSGRGWSNPRDAVRLDLDANQDVGAGLARLGASDAPGTTLYGWGRRTLVQSVIMEVSSPIFFAAGEPVEFSVDARLDFVPLRMDEQERRAASHGLIAAFGRDASYTVLSRIPALNRTALRGLALPEESTWLAPYLALPDSITPRTVALAEEITRAIDAPYDKAEAIESYLRQFAYDLTVSEPPAGVGDVADYFLFDLQRGYCDYYATAFVVLARLAGLPTRFATGYAVGQWDFNEGVWVITEAEAHSWPEVYFADVGWIPFEPTAGRPTLPRIGTSELPPMLERSAPLPAPEVTPETEVVTPNWQTWLWVLPALAVLWGIVVVAQQWLRRREDPWQSVLRWGERVGRPMGEGETALEYGTALAGMASRASSGSNEVGRVIAREVLAISRAVSRWVYGPPAQRNEALQAIQAHWTRLAEYIRRTRR